MADTVKLQTDPDVIQLVQDRLDAARYRWLRDFADSYTWDYLGGIARPHHETSQTAGRDTMTDPARLSRAIP